MIKKGKSLFFIIMLISIFLVVIFAPNRYTSSDPRGCLLVSESILSHQTIKLDHYGKELLQLYGYRIHEHKGHFYYYFPIGTALLSLPFVAFAKVIGLDVRQYDATLQIIISAITSTLTFFYMFNLARIFLAFTSSLIIASIFWFGTSLSSTCGTALWSHNFATLFGIMVIYYIIKVTKKSQFQLWFLISFCLFFAFLCRPTMALLVPFVLIYLFTYNRMIAVKTTILLIVLLAFFALFNEHEFGQILPEYYSPKRLAGQNLPNHYLSPSLGLFLKAFYGNLLSPARGLIVYSPFILFAFASP